MEGLSLFTAGLGTIFSSPKYLLLVFAFVAIGILLGAMPGISVNLSLILCLPMTYGMDSQTAMTVLIACYVGALSGGLISAIALNIPGTTSSIATCFDGHPLARNGQAGRAIGVGILTSSVGGIISYIMLIFITPLLAAIAMKFGHWEYFAIGIFSLTMIIDISGDDVIKGVLAALFGMVLATTGGDPINGSTRFNLGFRALDGGVVMTALMCGMFAVPEIMKLADNRADEELGRMRVEPFKGYGISFKAYISQWWNVLRSAVLGAYVGLLPGIGASSASLFAYSTAKAQSKHPEEFGKGSYEGLIASETANNACMGGAMIPMLALGIPGSSAAAILMNALLLHNVTTGPLVFTENGSLVYFVFALCFVSILVMFVLERVMLRGYLKVLSAPRRILMVVVILMCLVGSYSARNNIMDVFVFAIGGTIGYFLQKVKISSAPIILGFILGPIIEVNFARAYNLSRGHWQEIFSRPITLIFLVIAVLAFANSIRKTIKASKQRKAVEQAELASEA